MSHNRARNRLLGAASPLIRPMHRVALDERDPVIFSPQQPGPFDAMIADLNQADIVTIQPARERLNVSPQKDEAIADCVILAGREERQ